MYENYENQENGQPEEILEAQPQSEPQEDPQVETQAEIPEEPRTETETTPQPSWAVDEPYVYTPPKKEKSGFTPGKIIAIALICSLLGGIFGAGGMYCLNRYFNEAAGTNQSPNGTTIVVGDRESSVIDIAQIDTGKPMSQAEVYAKNVSSTVGITTSITTNYWGYQTTSAASGSGFIFSTDGYILTNFHVVEGSDSITVSMYDGKTYAAKLIGYDESNDIAVLKINAEGLVPVVLGDSDNVNVGDNVVAIGNPLGELTFSLTAGSISAKDRDVTMSNGVTMSLMQTDCAINSGNSGGALFNLYGEVIGITNAKYSSSSTSSASIDNIGFAIPINTARSIAEIIIEKGYVPKPYLGISVTTVSTEAQSYGMPQGAAVRGVENDSPAEQSGLKVNDIITHINGNAITGSNDLSAIVSKVAIGEELKLTVYRQGATLELSLIVGEQIQSVNTQQNQSQSQNQRPQSPWG